MTIVGLGGTIRPGSASETALIKALAAAEGAGARTKLFGGAFLAALPHYNPHQPATHPEQVQFLHAVSRANGGELFDGDGAFIDPRDAAAVETVALQVVSFAAAWDRQGA
jgi:hypothetical protein